MVYLHQLADKSFIMLRAEWTAEEARELVEGLEATHVIVHRTDPEDYYYLYTLGEAWNRLEDADGGTAIAEVFGLHESDATPMMDAYADGERTPDRVIVVEEDRVIGFYDVHAELLSFGAGPEKSVIRGKGGPTEDLVTRALVAEFPEEVALEQTRSLLVYLSAESEAGRPELPIAVPTGTTVDVVVQARRGFEVVGSSEGHLTVMDTEQTQLLQFKLKATEIGPGQIRVIAFQNGQFLGWVTVAPLVVEATEVAREQPQTQEQEMGIVSIHQPDLQMFIIEQKSGDQMKLTMHLTARDSDLGLFMKPFGPIAFETSVAAYFKDFFSEIESLDLSTPQDRADAEQELGNKGTHLFRSVFPEDLQVLLWSLRDRITTVQIMSDEPWIPWELCKLVGKEEGRVVEGPFLCQVFSVTRWVTGLGQRPALTLNKIGLVVPQDSGLAYAKQELAYIQSLAAGARQVERVTALRKPLLAKLAKGECDGWHFTGHGSFKDRPDRSAMVLEASQELRPEDLSGVASNLGLAHPLVFLNACEIGRSAMSLTDVGGWAGQFLRAGAAAFVGAFWSIYDESAVRFAQTFYGQLLAGVPIGQAVREARLAIKAGGDPTWLAYTVFADPLATVQA